MGNSSVMVVGAGLAGSEAAWQVAKRGVPVTLVEMRPNKLTPAHHSGGFAELVCSNSLKGAGLDNAAGLLKAEMGLMDSLIIQAALAHRVPAGGALAVDRDGFAQFVTEKLMAHPLVTVVQSEVTTVPADRPLVIASGPLTSDALATSLGQMLGQEYLHFFDAAAPIVAADSIDWEKVYRASRYDKGEPDYVNCPLEQEEYVAFYHALLQAEVAPKKDFERESYFEGCLPVEVLAKRGLETLLFGPLKPVGLLNPRTGSLPHAVVQLRQDNQAATLYNLVGFQTNLKWPEQKRVFRMIPGLEQAEFVRFGVMHRNTFLNSPQLLSPTLAWREDDSIFFAGQMTGVEGYVESAASGLVAGINAARLFSGQEPLQFPVETAHGALLSYITTEPKRDFQPMNMTFGLFPPLPTRIRGKKERGAAHSERAMRKLREFLDNYVR